MVAFSFIWRYYFLPALQRRGIARIFKGGGGGGWKVGVHTVSHPGQLHAPLEVLGPANGVCNYLLLEKIYGMLNLGICTFSPAEL